MDRATLTSISGVNVERSAPHEGPPDVDLEI